MSKYWLHNGRVYFASRDRANGPNVKVVIPWMKRESIPMSEPSDDALLDEIEAALAKATPGEWMVDNWQGGVHTIKGDFIADTLVTNDAGKFLNADKAKEIASLIALSHNALPRLLYLARIGVKYYDEDWEARRYEEKKARAREIAARDAAAEGGDDGER